MIYGYGSIPIPSLGGRSFTTYFDVHRNSTHRVVQHDICHMGTGQNWVPPTKKDAEKTKHEY